MFLRLLLDVIFTTNFHLILYIVRLALEKVEDIVRKSYSNVYLTLERYIHIYFNLNQDKATGRQLNNSPSEKKGTLRTVRQFMKLGKQRHQRQTSRDSSTEDEGR